jgi:hypothetical protein
MFVFDLIFIPVLLVERVFVAKLAVELSQRFEERPWNRLCRSKLDHRNRRSQIRYDECLFASKQGRTNSSRITFSRAC